MIVWRRERGLKAKQQDQRKINGLEYKHLKLSVDENIALITLIRPQQMNAFTPEMLESRFDALMICEQDTPLTWMRPSALGW
jgi:hypothetical protein